MSISFYITKAVLVIATVFRIQNCVIELNSDTDFVTVVFEKSVDCWRNRTHNDHLLWFTYKLVRLWINRFLLLLNLSSLLVGKGIRCWSEHKSWSIHPIAAMWEKKRRHSLRSAVQCSESGTIPSRFVQPILEVNQTFWSLIPPCPLFSSLIIDM